MLRIYKRLYVNKEPLEKIYTEKYNLIVELDDENKKRRKISFEPLSCFRILPLDYYDEYSYYVFEEESNENGCSKKHIIEKTNSGWIDELDQMLRTNPLENDEFDCDGKKRHFILILGNRILEIIADDCKIIK